MGGTVKQSSHLIECLSRDYGADAGDDWILYGERNTKAMGVCRITTFNGVALNEF